MNGKSTGIYFEDFQKKPGFRKTNLRKGSLSKRRNLDLGIFFNLKYKEESLKNEVWTNSWQ